MPDTYKDLVTIMKTNPAPVPQQDAAIQSRQLEELYRLMEIEPDEVEDEWLVLSRMRDICKERQYLTARNKLQQRDIEKLTRYLDLLQHDVLAVERSRAWRLGFRIVATLKSLTGRPAGRHVFGNVHRTLGYYHHWKKSRD